MGGQRRIQQGHISVGGLWCVQRVGAQRIRIARLVRQFTRRIKVKRTDRRDHTQRYVIGSCPRTHGGRIRPKLWCIQMAMGVHPGRHAVCLLQVCAVVVCLCM